MVAIKYEGGEIVDFSFLRPSTLKILGKRIRYVCTTFICFPRCVIQVDTSRGGMLWVSRNKTETFAKIR